MLKISSLQAKTSLKRASLMLLAFTVMLSGIYTVFQPNKGEIASANSCNFIFDPLPTWVTDRVNQNRSTYEQVQKETGVPWEVMASIHYREFNLRRDINPANGQGIYQMYSIYQTDAAYRALAVTSSVTNANFLEQTRYAARFVQDKARNTTRTPIVSPRNMVANETDLNLIKSTLFSYNGRAAVYANQAEKYGFDKVNQPFEGSPYVMNQFDCKRTGMGLITYDGGSSLNGTDTRLGAFTLYARLKGDSYWNGLQIGNIPGCREATNTTISCVWRLYNSGTKKYTMATSFDERNKLIAQGYLYQNTAFFGNHRSAGRQGNIPVYEVRNSQNGSLITANENEYASLKAAGWRDMGVVFRADPGHSNTGLRVHRLYNSSTQTHLWTTDTNEIRRLQNSGYINEGVAFTSISTVRQEVAPPTGQELTYRFTKMPGNRHFWTKDVYERDSMIRAGYKYEGVAWRVSQKATSLPVYRLYSPTMKKHLYTTDAYEKDVLNRTSSWRYEGIAWYSNPSHGGDPVFRLYSPHNAAHFYTTSPHERDKLKNSGSYRYEGVSWRQP